MSAALPDHLDPWRAVKTGLSFSGQVLLRHLPRLAAVVVDRDAGLDAPVNYRLRFERDQNGRAVVLGQVWSQLRLPCQRCLGEVVIEIDVPLRLGLLHTEQAVESLADDLDPLVVGDEPLHPLDLIEDELLLAIPVVPRHDSGLCQPPDLSVVPAARESVAKVEQDEAVDPPHPFAVLAALKPERHE
ncbi:YceD family protein [Thiobaca trueperi]|uniref:Large ribosomal RNA subunit accumulation protein YceD n=1 Tax=Thiobaca trueperi TaxID=127458 RepID=A0A4R3MYB9_9GAMM|nr:YceD family protein [Thiobaca trueperi]TCT20827.1 uncharacterized protein EDC35_105271 [Thiobaca trueperi]